MSNWKNVHPKVAASTFGGAVAAVILAIAKDQFDLNLSGQEPNIAVIVTVLTAYLFPGEE